jgi:tetratricopeptide (TPR) repeat protein
MTTPNPQPDPQQQPKPVLDAGHDEADTSEKLVLTSPDAADSPRDFGLWIGVLFLLALTIYSPAMRGEFLWDDDRHVTQNQMLRSADGLRRIWTEIGATPQYYPLTHTTYWIEYQLFGKGASATTLDPLVFHITNILLHALGATLLWFILRRLRVPGAWLAAAVFAVHPVNVESVAWISERKNVLSGAFFFGSILAYLRFEGIGDEDHRLRPPRENWNFYALAVFLFVCALLSKTVACSMPAVVLVLLWWKRGKLRVADVLPLVPLFVIGAGMALLTSHVEQTNVIGSHYAIGDWRLSPVQRVLIAARALWFYPMKLILPLELTFTYPRWHVDPSDPLQWLPIVGVIFVTVALWALRKRIGRAPLTAWLIYAGVLVPALGFFDIYPMRYSFVADHFQYHASAAMIALIVGGAVYWFRRVTRSAVAAGAAAANEQSPTPYVASAVVLLVLCALAWWQSYIYTDSVTLWRDTVRKNPSAWMAHHNLGYDLTDLAHNYQKLNTPEAKQFSKDLLEEAVGHLETTTKLRPDHDDAYLHWGRALLQQGKDAQAMEKFEHALQLNPANVEAMTNRAYMLKRAGKMDEALAAYRDAVATCEKQPPSQHGKCGYIAMLYGKALEEAKKPDEALAAYTRATRLAPLNVDAHYALGTLLALRAGNAPTPEEHKATLAAAADEFLAILRRDPRHQDAEISLALLMIEAGNLQGAQRELVNAARINPNAPRLMDAAKLFSAAMDRLEASTRPSTTQSSTQPTTQRATTHATTQSLP